MTENKFKTGDLVVPNDDVMAAFRYDPESTELYEEVSYRLATETEYVHYFKNRGMTEVNGSLDNYKKSVQKEVGDVYKSIENEQKNNRKHGLS